MKSLATCVLFTVFCFITFFTNAQIIITIPATGNTGGFQTGSVSAGGIKNDGLMGLLSSNNCRGWAVFDLSAIPTGATINNVSINFTTSSNSISSTGTNFISGYSWTSSTDPSIMSGTSLYSLLSASSSSNFNASSWLANATQNKIFNASGLTFIGNNIGGKVILSFVRGSANNYEILGYNAGSNSLSPELIIQYTAAPNCSGNPIAGNISGNQTVCANTSFNLLLSGTSFASELSYQWISKPLGSNIWSSIFGATTATYSSVGISAETAFRVVVSCTNSNSTDTTPVFSVNLDSFNHCYCTSGASNASDDEILNVSFGGLNNSSSCSTLTSGNGSIQNRYSNYTNLNPTSITQGQQVSFSVQVGTCGGNFNNCTKIFIDYNHDGSFSGFGEEVYASVVAQNGPHTESGYVLIPINSLTGNTRLRVVTVETSSSSNVFDCGNYNWGETEDYTINIIQAVNCNGIPSAGTVTTPNAVCNNTSFTLQATGYSIASNLSFQWEYSDSTSGNWNTIQGATTPNFQLQAGINIGTDFRLRIVCNNTGDTVYSNISTTSIKSFSLCYCIPNQVIALNSITQVSIIGTSLNNTTTASTASGYVQFYPTTSYTTTELTQGVQYAIQVTNANSNYVSSAWIDFNGNGGFDPTEFISFTSSGNISSATFVVPSNAFVGAVGLRIRSHSNPFLPSEACTNNVGFETEDYIITINQAQPCNGIPNTSTASAIATVCSNSPFTLNATNFSTGIGISYQWEYSLSGNNSWSVISGATNPIYVLSGGISDATDFRFKTVCSPNEDFSTSNTITVGISPFYNCYCFSSATSSSDEEIFQVNIGSLHNNSVCGTLASGSGSSIGMYSNYKYLSPSVIPIGNNIPFSITVGTCGNVAYQNIAAIYIDFNQNGSFADAGENVFTSPFAASTTSDNKRILSGTINIPITASTGITGIRVVFTESSNIDACGTYSWGETEDYLVNLINVTPCNGTPTTAIINGPLNVCAISSFNLSASYYPTNSGINFQWQSTPTGTNNWTDIPSATDPFYSVSNGINAATSFRLVSTCVSSNLNSISNAANVNLSTLIQCYCIPGNTDPTSDDQIVQVSIAGFVNNTGVGNANGYNDYTNSFSAIQLIKNNTYPVGLMIANGGNEYGAIWIDWNQNGTFDSTEFYNMGMGANPMTLNQNILVPISATTGNTLIRVRSRLGVSFSWADACVGYDYGETEDYLLKILAPTPCNSNQLSATIIAPALICPNTSFDLLTVNYNAATGLSYQWQSTPANNNNWTSISGSTNLNFTLQGGISTAQKFRLQITCNSSGTSGYSNEITVTPQNNIQLINQDSIIVCGSINLSAATGFSSYSWSNGGVSSSTIVDATGWYFCNASSGNCTVSDSIYVVVLPLPIIDAGADQFVCSGMSTSLFASGGLNYQWSGNVIDSIPFTPNSSTTYFVTGTGINGCNNTDSVVVYVEPIPIVSAGNNRSICVGGSASLTASGADSYLWNTGETTQSITVYQTGFYWVVGTTNYGCIDTSNLISVSVKSLPSLVKIKYTNASVVCEPSTINLVIDLPYGSTSGFAYQWNQNGSPISGATDSVYYATSSGSYTLSVSGGQFCNKKSAPKTVTVKPLPIATFSASGATNICAGGIVTLNAPALSGYIYTWLKDGVSVGSGVSKIIKVGGVYTVVAKLNGCIDTANNPITIVVNSLPVASVAATTSSTFCNGDSCTIQASPIANGNSYQWLNGSSVLATSSSSIYKAKIVATIKVIITDVNGCISKASATSVKTKVNPIPVASISPAGPVSIVANGSIKLNASPSSGVTWQWFKNGVAISGATTKQLTANTNGSFTVAITKSGCMGISSPTVVTQSAAKETGVSVITDESFEMIAYPNPTVDNLTIQINGIHDFENAEISIIDLNGKQMGRWQFSNTKDGKMNIDLSKYASGYYLVRFKSGDGNTGILKIEKD